MSSMLICSTYRVDLQGFFDYKQALAYSKKVNKPVFIDFTGHGCVNCREMEARVWSDPAVMSRLQNDFVIGGALCRRQN